MQPRSHPSPPRARHPRDVPTGPLVAVVGTRYREYEIEERALVPLGARLRVCTDPEQALDATLVLAGSTPRYSADVLERMPRCRAIVRYGVGLDRIDLEAAARLGIAVHNVPDFCTEEVSGHAVAMILAFSRRLLDGARALAAGGWGLERLRPVKAAEDEVVAVIGAGRIGGRTAEKLRALGYRVVVHDAWLAGASASWPRGRWSSTPPGAAWWTRPPWSPLSTRDGCGGRRWTSSRPSRCPPARRSPRVPTCC